MQPYVHITVRAHTCPVSLVAPEVAVWLWSRLRDAFPEALAACLMPTHPHLLVPARDADVARRKLGRVVNGLRRSRNPGAAIRWCPASVKGCFSEPKKIARQARYIELNPSRAELTRDPLTWLWTTHRDVMGAVIDPWVDATRLAAALRWPEPGFPARWHGYVSGDPSCNPAGTPLPLAAKPIVAPLVPISDVLAAALAATRSPPEAIRRPSEARRVFVSLAASQGWRDAPLLAELCGMSPRSARWYLARATPPAGEALLCLGDARLLAPIRSNPAK